MKSTQLEGKMPRLDDAKRGLPSKIALSKGMAEGGDRGSPSAKIRVAGTDQFEAANCVTAAANGVTAATNSCMKLTSVTTGFLMKPQF